MLRSSADSTPLGMKSNIRGKIFRLDLRRCVLSVQFSPFVKEKDYFQISFTSSQFDVVSVPVSFVYKQKKKHNYQEAFPLGEYYLPVKKWNNKNPMHRDNLSLRTKRSSSIYFFNRRINQKEGRRLWRHLANPTRTSGILYFARFYCYCSSVSNLFGHNLHK